MLAVPVGAGLLVVQIHKLGLDFLYFLLNLGLGLSNYIVYVQLRHSLDMLTEHIL